MESIEKGIVLDNMESIEDDIVWENMEMRLWRDEKMRLF